MNELEKIEKLAEEDREKLIQVTKLIGDLKKLFPEVKSEVAKKVLTEAKTLLNKTNDQLLKLIINLK